MTATTRFLGLLGSRARDVRDAFTTTDFEAFADLGSEANRRLTLVILGSVAGLGGLIGTAALLPYAERLDMAVGEIVGMGVVLVGLGAAALLMPGRTPTLVIEVFVAGAVAAVSVAVVLGTGRVAGHTVLIYFWTAVIVALLRPAASTVVHFVLIAAASGLVFALDDTFADPLFWWGLVVLTLAVVWQSIGWLARQARTLAVRERTTRAKAERTSAELRDAHERKSRFLATMSHELRTPMNAIVGFGEMLQRGAAGPLSERQAEYVGDIVDSGRHLTSLIDDTLDEAMVEEGQYQVRVTEIDVRELVHDSVTLVRERAAGAGVKVVVTLGDVGGVRLDRRKIRQVLTNLLSNAVKFTPSGGTVTVLARRSDGTVEFSVADTGPGIDPAHHESVFEEFHQTHAADDEGTGLGLSVARRFVELHGGRIWVDSAPGDGACFTFTLPTVPPSFTDSEARPRGASERSTERRAPRIVTVRTIVKRSYFFAGAIVVGCALGGLAADSAGISRWFFWVAAAGTSLFMVVAGVGLTVGTARTLLIVDLTIMFAGAVLAGVGYYYLGPLAPAVVAVWLVQAFYVRLLFLKIDMRGTWGHWFVVAVSSGVVLTIQSGNEAPLAQWLAVVSTVWISSFLVGWLIRRLQDIALAEHRAAREISEVGTALEAAGRHKTQFLAGMSHELRTPLNAIVGFAELLDREVAGPLTARQREYVGDILESGSHLLRLINDVLDLVKIDAGRLEIEPNELELAPLVSDGTADAREIANQKGVEFRLHVAPGTRLVADSARITQVISALASNAVKFTPEGGRVEINAGTYGDVTRLVVTDTGPGLDVDHELLFEAFHQGSSDPVQANEGSGLGLALAHRLVSLHDGTLTVTSVRGQSTTVTVTLPVGHSAVDTSSLVVEAT